MKSHLLGAVRACVLFFWLVSTTNAALVEIDLLSAEDKIITRDTRTGLEWLDLDATPGVSVGNILRSEAWVNNYGFRFATAEEVSDLWVNSFGVNLTAGGFISINYAPAQNLVAFMGGVQDTTSAGDIDRYIWGSNRATPSNTGWRQSYVFINDTNSTAQFSLNHQDQDLENSLQDQHFLVRATVVPLPPALLLFGSGLLGLFGISRRKRSA